MKLRLKILRFLLLPGPRLSRRSSDWTFASSFFVSRPGPASLDSHGRSGGGISLPVPAKVAPFIIRR